MEKKINRNNCPRTTRILMNGKETVCLTLDGRLLFYQADTGSLLRELRMDGETILAIGLHPDGDKLRVATDRQMHLVEWKQ
ncbi:hypothetical protein [Staphylospora marina]|uniref:hypothetical protein n=1 Tax=Staphylospora marina TaxID=2490858 RepID=UPI000F5BBFF8|nr:hypothetical protein [Staphylospora marina]